MCLISLAADTRPQEPIAFEVLTTWLKRLKGLLGTDEDADPVALVRCNSIHTFAMPYPIDIAFVDEQGLIVWKRKLPHPGDGPKHQKKGSDGKIEDVRWNEKQETTKRIYGQPPCAIVYDIHRIYDEQVK